MSVEKAELKMLMAEHFGREMEQARDEAKAGISVSKGASKAFLMAEQVVNDKVKETKDKILRGVDVDVKDPVELAKFFVSETMTIARKIHELGDNAASSILRGEGAVRAWDLAAEMHFKTFKAEKAKLDAAKATAESPESEQKERGPSPPRSPGLPPGPTLKTQRQTVAKKKRSKSAVEKKAPTRKTPARKPTEDGANAKNA